MPVIKNEMQLNYLDFSKRKLLHFCNKQIPICYGCGNSMVVLFDLEIVKNYIGNIHHLEMLIPITYALIFLNSTKLIIYLEVLYQFVCL